MALRYLTLTPKLIATLRPGEQRQENGIIATRLNNGDLRWSINTMVDGVRIHRVIGTESAAATRQVAEQAIEKLRTEARDQRLSLPRRRKTHKKFAEASKDYMDRLRREDGKNLVAKDKHFRVHLVPAFGSLPINKISEERLASYRRQRRAEGAKDTTINREMATLAHFYSKASSRTWGWLSADDIPAIRFTPEPKLPFKVLSKEELQKLRLAAAQEGPQESLFVEMMAGSAMRPMEVLRARFEHLHATRDELFIPQAKAGARSQPLTRELARTLRQHRERKRCETGDDTGWFFPSPLTKLKKGERRASYHSMFRRCVLRAGLDPHYVTAYTLKRTSITDAAKHIDVAGLMKITGHATVESVLRYIQTRDEDISETMHALELRGSAPPN